jgi:hypothetical protein
MPAGRGCGLAIGPPAVMSLEAANGRACLGNSTLALATRGRRRASFNQTAASPDGLIKARIDLDLVGTLAGFPRIGRHPQPMLPKTSSRRIAIFYRGHHEFRRLSRQAARLVALLPNDFMLTLSSSSTHRGPWRQLGGLLRPFKGHSDRLSEDDVSAHERPNTPRANTFPTTAKLLRCHWQGSLI